MSARKKRPIGRDPDVESTDGPAENDAFTVEPAWKRGLREAADVTIELMIVAASVFAIAIIARIVYGVFSGLPGAGVAEPVAVLVGIIIGAFIARRRGR